MRTGTSLLVSIAIHSLVIALLVGTVAGSAASNSIERDAPHLDQDDEEKPEVLGIEESTAETVTWIGYEEYEKHLAQLSKVEQAAMVDAPISGGGGGPTGSSASGAANPSPPPLPGERRPSISAPAATVPAVPSEKPERLIDPELRTDPTTTPTETPTEADPKTPTEARTNEESPTDSPTTKPSEQDSPRETEEKPPEKPTETESTKPPEKTPEDTPSEKPTPKPGDTPSPTPAPSNEPTPAPQPEPSEEPTDSSDEGPGQGPNPPTEDSGNESNQDATPTSIVQTPKENWQNGRPLAAQGLDLQPKRIRPGHEIPTLVLANSRLAKNPVIELRFPRWSGKGRGVKPDTAKIVSSTGDATFDGYLLDALYGWLAKGEKLKTLGPGETTLVRLTLLMR